MKTHLKEIGDILFRFSCFCIFNTGGIYVPQNGVRYYAAGKAGGQTITGGTAANFSNSQIKYSANSTGWTATKDLALYNRMQTLLTAIAAL